MHHHHQKPPLPSLSQVLQRLSSQQQEKEHHQAAPQIPDFAPVLVPVAHGFRDQRVQVQLDESSIDDQLGQAEEKEDRTSEDQSLEPSATAVTAAVTQVHRSSKPRKSKAKARHKVVQARSITSLAERALVQTERDRSTEFNLLLDINDLRQEIQQLMTKKQLHESQAFVNQCAKPQDGFYVHVVREYCRVFRLGHGEFRAEYQRNFLAQIMSPTVDCGQGQRGIDHVWSQFMNFNRLLPVLLVEMHSVEVVRLDNQVMVRTRGSFQAPITKLTIQHAFPHVSPYDPTVNRVLHAEVDWPCQWQFVFDTEGQVVRFGLQIDFVHAFTTLLGNLHQVEVLFRRARIAEQGSLLEN